MTNLSEHARREIARYVLDYGHAHAEAAAVAQELVDLLASKALGGGSDSLTTDLFRKLVCGEILTPLTGEAEEWKDVGDVKTNVYQNIRYPWVFKNNTEAWDTNAVWLEGPDGVQYRDGVHIHSIKFPYTPTTTIIQVDEDGHPIEPSVYYA